MKTNEKIIDYFNNKEEVKRIKELESYIDNNQEIKEKYQELLDLQKKIVSSKEYNQKKQYEMYLMEYNNKKEEFLNLPFVWEYIECLNTVSDEVFLFKDLLEDKIKKTIN